VLIWDSPQFLVWLIICLAIRIGFLSDLIASVASRWIFTRKKSLIPFQPMKTLALLVIACHWDLFFGRSGFYGLKFAGKGMATLHFDCMLPPIFNSQAKIKWMKSCLVKW